MSSLKWRSLCVLTAVVAVVGCGFQGKSEADKTNKSAHFDFQFVGHVNLVPGKIKPVIGTEKRTKAILPEDANDPVMVTADGKMYKAKNARLVQRRLAALHTDSTQGFHPSGSDSVIDRVTKSIVDADERIEVTSGAYPFSVFGYVHSGCSGTLVSSRHVLTAAHCVFNQREWKKDLRFSPGLTSGNSLPYGTIEWASVMAPNYWIEKSGANNWEYNEMRRFDYAIITLKEPIGEKAGWLGVSYNQSTTALVFNTAGYPNDKPAGTMWRTSCNVNGLTPEIYSQGYFLHTCDSAPGQSGAAMYIYNTKTKQRTVRGVHVGGIGSEPNVAHLINEESFLNIKGWIEKQE